MSILLVLSMLQYSAKEGSKTHSELIQLLGKKYSLSDINYLVKSLNNDVVQTGNAIYYDNRCETNGQTLSD